MNTRIKVCGITRPEDAYAASRLGVDAIGLVFYKPSSRYVSIELAQDIVAAVNPLVSVVGLFVDAGADFVHEVLQQVPLEVLQFHGNESSEFCESFHRPYFKALRVKNGDNSWQKKADEYIGANAILLDKYSDKAAGGTGESFDWSQIAPDWNKPLILAGGLNVENVASAVRNIQPLAVDVSSGVESSPGIKDVTLMTHFVVQVKTAQIKHQQTQH